MMDLYGFKIAQGAIFLSEAKWFWGLLDQNVRIGDPQTGFESVSRSRVEAVTKVALNLVRDASKLAGLKIKPDIDRLEQLIWAFEGAPRTGGAGIATSITHLLSRLQDELSERHFVRVTDASLYGRSDLFGPEVVKKFKTAAPDIENAGNCLALEQGTACVFHLMRAMEVAVRQLGRRLNITITPQTTWRQMTGQMDDKIKKMPDATDVQKRKKNNWEGARANLHHVGSVWRNNTMHPATSYTPSQALDVLNASRVFMNGLCAL
jgi:hypothetical protein